MQAVSFGIANFIFFNNNRMLNLPPKLTQMISKTAKKKFPFKILKLKHLLSYLNFYIPLTDPDNLFNL